MSKSVTPLDGINEKLKRADQSIQNLQGEISWFFQQCEYPVIPQINDERHSEAVRYHQKLIIPPRFSVLAGEIIHQCRSCFDHIAWALSSDSYRNSSDGKYIEFPILEVQPLPKNEFTSYERKIKGISSPRALQIIKELQPYNRLWPRTHPLWVIYDLDRVDKHRTLVIVNNIGRVDLPNPTLAAEFARSMSKKPPRFTPEFRKEFDKYAKVTPQVVFRNFAGRKFQFVIPGLQDVLDFTRYVVGLLESDLLKC